MFVNSILKNRELKEDKGITLMSLVITIVILLILAGISISGIVGKNGIIDQSLNAKNSTEINEEKDIVKMAYITADGKRSVVTVESMQKEINKLKENVTVMETGNSLLVKFNENNRYYEIDIKGNVEYLGTLEEKILKVQCIDSVGSVLLEKEYIIIKEEYSIMPLKIEGYESSVEKIEGQLNQSDIIQVLYYQIFQDDTTLVFTGLDSNGNIAIDEASIISYMVGDGTTIAGNGIIEKKALGILKIPNYYKEKPVIKISQYAFHKVSNIKEAIIGDCVETISSAAFHTTSGMEKVVIGKNVKKYANICFWVNSKLETVVFKTDTIDPGAFGWCDNLTNVVVENTTHKVVDNIIYSKDGKELVLCPVGKKGDFIIPNGVVTIKTYAFYRNNLTSITIPDSVLNIERAAISEHSNLKTLIIGDNVEKIDNFAFWHCFGLETVIIDSSIVGNVVEESSCQYLFENPNVIYINQEITTIGNYIIENFTIEISDKDGYVKYVKNV